MNIAIIDADLIFNSKHRFPNLACMKMSGYYKEKGFSVVLKTNYEDLQNFDKVFISKVFTKTEVPEDVLILPNVEYGGTGFFYDKAPHLDYSIEHHMPDYNLYDEWVQEKINQGKKIKEFEYYFDYSIGFTTRGCVRQCEFCVNKNYKQVYKHSPVSEFYDSSKKYICLLDDNILAYKDWKETFTELKDVGKPFQYKQGMDERLLTEEKINTLIGCKYKGDYIFAFDDIRDSDIIKRKLDMWTSMCKKRTKFYVFCGFDRGDKWDSDFWNQDIVDTFERIYILMTYGCLPYIMRFEKYEDSPHRGMYINLARWCNQPQFFKKYSFREYCMAVGQGSACERYMREFENKFPDVANKYFDLHFKDVNKFNNN